MVKSDDPFEPEFHLATREAWYRASPYERDLALIEAVAEIDRTFRFRGVKSNPRQSMAWPRIGLIDQNGESIRDIPAAVKEATALLAHCIIAGKPLWSGNRERDARLVAILRAAMANLLDPDDPFLEETPSPAIPSP